jgi:cytochrome c oxidase subunit 2
MFDLLSAKYQRFSPLFLRIGLAVVFVFFGIQKLANPGQGTSETQLITNFELADAAAINFYLGLVEIAIAISFVVGFKVRLFAIVSSLLIVTFFLSFLSKYGVSLNPDLYRDIGLIGASIALFLLGSGPMSIDSFFAKKETTVNKYLGLIIFGVILMTSGFVYQQYYRPANIGGFKSTGEVVEVHMRVIQNTWKWDPDTIRVNPGDKVVLHIFNEDTYDHGFAIDVFGVNRRLFPKNTTVIEFTPSIPGKFNFYCSVPCGQGHYDQVGTLIVGDEKVSMLSFQALASNSFLFKDTRQCQK